VNYFVTCQKSHILTYPTCIWPMSIVAKWLAVSRCQLVWRYRPYPRPHCDRWGTQLPLPEKGTQQPPLFDPCLLWPNSRPSQQLLSFCAKWIHTAFFDHATYHSRQKLAKTLRHLGQDSSALRSEMSLGHFCTSDDLSGQFGPTRLVPKCPGSEMSWFRSVCNSM